MRVLDVGKHSIAIGAASLALYILEAALELVGLVKPMGTLVAAGVLLAFGLVWWIGRSGAAIFILILLGIAGVFAFRIATKPDCSGKSSLLKAIEDCPTHKPGFDRGY
ncbi:MAG: hypothetical protein KDA53_16405 [Hyphomonas sp.]|nr:hypothetical protein [Hyphomonas sp.]